MGIFKPGKITTILDGGAGSSSKGLRAAYVWKNMREEHSSSAINTFMENAAHSITHDDGREYIHQCLSSITTVGEYDAQFLSPGCVFAEETINKELSQFDLSPSKVGIHPNAVIVTQKDVDYERGLVDFEGNKKEIRGSSNLNIGSTLHGVGAARARRILRRPDVILAKDVESLKPYVRDTANAVMKSLDNGFSVLGEIAQGYQLSLMNQFYPRTTSRNCSVSAFLDDSLLPPSVVGPAIVNFRTFPIRVNNNKYVRRSDGKILTWNEYLNTSDDDKFIVKGDSGGCYSDQQEVSWDYISELCGERIFECTSLTKLPRRCFSFSKINLIESLRYNNTNDDMYISINFINYVDNSVKGKRTKSEVLTPKVITWLKDNVVCDQVLRNCLGIKLNGLFIGTWKTIDDSVFLSKSEMMNL